MRLFHARCLHPPGKCREFLRFWFTFPRGRMGYRLYMPLSPHLQSLPPGKVPDFSAKTVHFPPWPDGVPALQASLAALIVSTSWESAGNSCDFGSRRGRLVFSRCWNFHRVYAVRFLKGVNGVRGKCREFPRKWCTFPRRMPMILSAGMPVSPHA